MTCEELAALLGDYHDGDLAVEIRETFDLHVTGCPHCVVSVENYHLTVRVTRALPKCDPLSEKFEGRLRAALLQGRAG